MTIPPAQSLWDQSMAQVHFWLSGVSEKLRPTFLVQFGIVITCAKANIGPSEYVVFLRKLASPTSSAKTTGEVFQDIGLVRDLWHTSHPDATYTWDFFLLQLDHPDSDAGKSNFLVIIF